MKSKNVNNYPKITVISPSFNQASYLEETITSVLNQDYPNLEYLIFDGGSTDGSVEIIQKYAKKYPKVIKWQSKKDKGQVNAINQALNQATGEIVAYINSDDYYLPGAFQRVVQYFHKNPDKLWVVGNCLVSDPKLRWTFWLKHLWPIHWSGWPLLCFNTINQPSVFLCKKLIDQVGLFDSRYKYAFDYDYWLRCLKFDTPGRIFSNLSVFRVHSASKGNTAFIDQFDEDLQVVNDYSTSSIAILIHKVAKLITVSIYQKYKR